MEFITDSWLSLLASVGMFVFGLRVLITKKLNRYIVPFTKPTSTITGLPAQFLGAMMIVGAVLVALTTTEFMQVDRCLDNGGKYDYVSKSCLFK